MCLTLIPSHKANRSNENRDEAVEPRAEIWGMPSAADTWRRSCAGLRAPRLPGRWSDKAAHTRLCLLSLWQGKDKQQKRRKERRTGRNARRGGERTVSGWEEDWWYSKKKIKVSAETEPINKESYQEDIGRALLLLECSHTLRAPKNTWSVWAV